MRGGGNTKKHEYILARKGLNLTKIIYFLCKSREVSRFEIAFGGVPFLFFDYNNSSLSIPKEFGVSLAVLSALFLLFIYNSYWKTIDGGLAPEKFSQKNLATRDIVIKYASKAYLFLMFLLLMLQVIEESGNVFVIT